MEAFERIQILLAYPWDSLICCCGCLGKIEFRGWLSKSGCQGLHAQREGESKNFNSDPVWRFGVSAAVIHVVWSRSKP